MDSLIRLENISYKKNNQLILDSIDLKITKGEFVSILGPSGSGKTSLINILMDRDTNYTGLVSIFGDNVSKNCCISILSENYSNIFVTNKVSDELLFPLQKLNLSEEEKNNRFKMIVSSLGLSSILNFIPSSLSSGEKVLVSLGSLLITYPDILVIDEALEMVDRITKDKIFSLLKRMRKINNITFIYVTQNSEDILFTDRIILLYGGKVYLDSNIKNAFNDDKIYRNAGINFPFMVDLCKKLQYYELVDKIEFNMDKLVNKLWK